MSNKQSNEPPLALVKTWLHLARTSELGAEAQLRALSMLKTAIGKPEEIKEYMKEHGLE